ncbi:MAG: PAS domain S-box protein, partial [Rhodospirillaceae bacterium]
MRDANTSPEPPHPPQPDGGEVDGAAGSGKLLGRFLGSVLRSRLTAKVLLGVFLGIVLIEIIILVPSYSKRERDLLENEYSRVSNFVGAVMRTPSVSQEQKLALIASGDGVLGMIVIRDPMLADRARTAAEARRAGREQADAIKPYHYEASAGRLAVDYPLSTAFGADADDRVLRIFVSAAHIPEHLEAYVLRIIGLVVIISLFVTGVTMVIVGILLIRPLLSLTRTIAAGQKLETLSTLPPQLMSRKDEIGELARAYRDMVTSISEAVSRIEALARFPYENPNPVLRVGFDYSVQYANGSAQAEQALFSNDSQTAISQDLRSLASSAVVSDESSTSTIVTGFRVFSVTAVPVREYGYLNLYARDITSQVQAEKDLLALNERLEGLVEERSAELRIQARRLRSTIVAAIDAIVLMGLDGTILDFNPSAEVLFGRTRDQVLGKDLTDLLVPEAMRERHRNSIIRYLETGKKTVIGKRIELEALRSDGQLIPVEVSLEVTGEGDDRIFVAFLRDITERRDRRQALIEAKEAAERANRAKSDFLATMSHEIRTPMNGVIGMTGLLMDTALSQEQSHYVETIRQSGESLMRIINDILDYTKIEAGRLELETMPFDLEGLV